MEVRPVEDDHLATLSCSCDPKRSVSSRRYHAADAMVAVVAHWNSSRERVAMPRVNLGQIVKDAVTGFIGTATGRIEYLSGSSQIQVTPRVDDTGKFVDPSWIEERRLEIVTAEERQ